MMSIVACCHSMKLRLVGDLNFMHLPLMLDAEQ